MHEWKRNCMQEQFREYNGQISQMFSISYVQHLLKKKKKYTGKTFKKKRSNQQSDELRSLN